MSLHYKRVYNKFFSNQHLKGTPGDQLGRQCTSIWYEMMMACNQIGSTRGSENLLETQCISVELEQ